MQSFWPTVEQTCLIGDAPPPPAEAGGGGRSRPGGRQPSDQNVWFTALVAMVGSASSKMVALL